MAFVYILTNKNNTALYVGVTNNLVRRVHEHKEKFQKGFSEKYFLEKLVYYEEMQDISLAIAREKQLKSWRREWKVRLIGNKNPSWKDLYADICF
ncbi:GIY-YIG nuclease family protein [Candidatus Avelusimicrobium sp.]